MQIVKATLMMAFLSKGQHGKTVRCREVGKLTSSLLLCQM